MELYDMTFFCKKGKGLVVSKIEEEGILYPFTLRISEVGSFNSFGGIKVYFESESDLIRFKNSVLEAFETYERKRRNNA